VGDGQGRASRSWDEYATKETNDGDGGSRSVPSRAQSREQRTTLGPPQRGSRRPPTTHPRDAEPRYSQLSLFEMICFGSFLSRASPPRTLPNLDVLSPQLPCFRPLSHQILQLLFSMPSPMPILTMAHRTLLSGTEISHSCLPICHLTIRLP
jgi:hypothetical protein